MTRRIALTTVLHYGADCDCSVCCVLFILANNVNKVIHPKNKAKDKDSKARVVHTRTI